MNQNFKKTTSLMDRDLPKISNNTKTSKLNNSQQSVKIEELIRNLDENVNNKVAQGFQMMISKVVVLIEEQVKVRVSQEVQEQLGKMMIRGSLTNKRQSDNLKSSESQIEQLVSNESIQSEYMQLVSDLDQEQSCQNIDKIDEES